MDQIRGYSESSIANPEASFGPIRAAGLDNINRSYQDVPQQVATQLARRGYGSSGEMGNSQFKVALGRAGAVSDFEGKLAGAAIDRQDRGASLGNQLLQMNRGTTSTGTTPDTSLQNGFLSAGNGLSNLSTLLMLTKVLKGSGGGGGGYLGSGETPYEGFGLPGGESGDYGGET